MSNMAFEIPACFLLRTAGAVGGWRLWIHSACCQHEEDRMYELCFTFTNTLSTITCCTMDCMEPHNIHPSVDLIHPFIHPSFFITDYHIPHVSCDLNLFLHIQKYTSQFLQCSTEQSPIPNTWDAVHALYLSKLNSSAHMVTCGKSLCKGRD